LTAVARRTAARCNAPLVYDSKHKVLVLFGGQNNLVRTIWIAKVATCGRRLNDTWLYDVTTRQWREAQCHDDPPHSDVATCVRPAERAVAAASNDAEDKKLAYGPSTLEKRNGDCGMSKLGPPRCAMDGFSAAR